MSELITYRLDQIAEVIDCEHKTAPKVDSSDYYSIRTPDIKNGRLLYEQANRVSAETYALWTKRGIPEAGDIILAREAPVGEVGWIDKDHKICLGQRTVLIKIHSPEIDKKYLLYSFVSPKFKDYLNELSGGSVVAHLNMKDIRALEFSFPPIPEQKAIASVLSSLDDKIDLLHRQNKTLEAMAETLFRQWFIEEAKEDWEVVSFVDFFDFLEGPGIRNWQYTESGTPFINIRLISNGDIDTSKASYISNEEANGKYKHFHLQAGDMIVSTSGTLGKNAIVRDYHLPLMLNTSVIRFRPKDGKNYSFVYQYLNSKLFQEHLESAASGSVQANFGPVHLKQMTLQKPPSEALMKFANQADGYYEKIRINQAQIKTLEQLRDTLLPKLMSGEVRVQY